MESTSSYQLKQDDEEYIFSLTLIEPNIRLSLEDSKGQIYAKVFSVEDIKSLDQIFSNVQAAFDIVESFDNILRNEKVRVEEESDLIQVVLYIAPEDREIKSLISFAEKTEEKHRLIIVTNEEERTITKNGVTIEVIPAYKFILDTKMT